VIAQFLTTITSARDKRGASCQHGPIRVNRWRLAQLAAVSRKAARRYTADVQRVSQKYMRNIRFVVLGNPTQIDKNVFMGQAGN